MRRAIRGRMKSICMRPWQAIPILQVAQSKILSLISTPFPRMFAPPFAIRAEAMSITPSGGRDKFALPVLANSLPEQPLSHVEPRRDPREPCPSARKGLRTYRDRNFVKNLREADSKVPICMRFLESALEQGDSEVRDMISDCVCTLSGCPSGAQIKKWAGPQVSAIWPGVP